ncbi:uncharacterized protein LOC129290758 isoform X2 [Prosopis cineraria]|nr:uncharacterized protein LOC129290758 isoform X2 [Prosopis cineraria]
MSCSSTSFTIDVVGAYHGSFVLESLLIARLSKPFIHDRHWFMGSIASDLCLLQFLKLKEMDARMVDVGASLNSAEVFGIPKISDLRNGQSFKEECCERYWSTYKKDLKKAFWMWRDFCVISSDVAF